VAPDLQPTPGGTLGLALPEGPGNLDPLFASTPADRLVARQMYEPLMERLSGPYGQTVPQPGLALAAVPVAEGTVWRLRLRPDVRFQDGSRFNASAVLLNTQRWRASSVGQALLPGLVAVDAPRPDQVRFIFDAPDPDLRRQLGSVNLGLVSPRVLRSAGATAKLAGGLAAGTGPFEPRRRGTAGMLLARNMDWWGTRRDLGPAVDLIHLRFEPSADRRLALLRRGVVQIAAGLGAAQTARIRADPLLTDVRGPGRTAVGLERSVRGFSLPSGVPLLSGTWLTTVGTASG
jgi:peptide/nickel transport system substrate-binding protein